MTLAACAHVGAAPATPDLKAPNPVIQRQTVTRFFCPTALGAELPPEPTPTVGAVVRSNEEGDAYLDARIARGDAAVQIVTDARAECRGAGADE